MEFWALRSGNPEIIRFGNGLLNFHLHSFIQFIEFQFWQLGGPKVWDNPSISLLTSSQKWINVPAKYASFHSASCIPASSVRHFGLSTRRSVRRFALPTVCNQHPCRSISAQLPAPHLRFVLLQYLQPTWTPTIIFLFLQYFFFLFFFFEKRKRYALSGD